MSELLSEITLPVRFILTGDEEFWADLAEEARRLDFELRGEDESTYSQAQALAVVFQADGLQTIESMMEYYGRAGWTVETPWEELGGIGDDLPAGP